MNTLRLNRPALAMTGIALALSMGTAAAQEPEPQVSETVNVEIKLVPFYAVDEEGQPVFDLKQDEIEVRVDGKPVAVDTFDAFPKVGGATTIANTGAQETAPVPAKAAPVKPSARRHVVLFFDIAFSNMRGFEKACKFAEKMVDEVPEADLLYVVTHDFQAGLKQRLGPVQANGKGKAKVLADLRKIKPEAGHIDANPSWGVTGLVDRGMGRNGVPANQNSAIDNNMRTNAQAQLEGTARSLADSMQVLADQFQRIKEPKLMVFLSQGINPTLYWEGSDVGMQFSSANYGNLAKNYTYRGLHSLYEKPMQQLADTGTMSLFVNLDDMGGHQKFQDSSMQHMARASGGLYLGGVDPSQVTDRFARSTSAYYEAGFYLTEASQQTSRAKVEVLVKRQGVRTWSAGTIKTRETYRGLSEDARRLLIVDLVEGDAEAQRSRSPVRLDLRNLPGKVFGRSDSGKTLLRYEAGWPQELAGRKIDLYNVVIEPTRQAGSPKILRFDRKEGTRVDAAGSLELEVPEKVTFVWGIVAVEPTSGRAWYRRFHLQGKVAQQE